MLIDTRMTGMQALQMTLVILALPVQYYIVKYSGNMYNDRELLRIINGVKSLSDVKQWQIWVCQNVVSQYSQFVPGSQKLCNEVDMRKGYFETQPESIAVEVMQFKEPEGHFAFSPEPRDKRPPNVRFRVGQVIKHKVYGYTGVIVGWDTTTKAPKTWIQDMHGDKIEWQYQPNYLVLVDEGFRGKAYQTYVVQENMELLLPTTEIKHPDIDEYFDFFDGSFYHMRGAMKELYPHD